MKRSEISIDLGCLGGNELFLLQQQRFTKITVTEMEDISFLFLHHKLHGYFDSVLLKDILHLVNVNVNVKNKFVNKQLH